MSINACSVNSFTIDALCGYRRQQIIDSLPPFIIPVAPDKGHPQHVHPDTKVPLNIFRRDDREEVDVSTLELPYITVTVEFNGTSQSQTIERDEVIPMVSVSSFSAKTAASQVEIDVAGLTIKEVDDSQVNISDVTIKVK